jgi:glycosyltransferase involved in cell wall biosynthesis
MKIFFISTHCSQGTGYGRVANKITNYLANLPGVEVVYYGFQNYKGQEIKDRYIDPRIKFYDAVEIDPQTPDGFGFNGIVPAITKEKPDALFMYLNMPIIYLIMEKVIPPSLMPPLKYLYLDTVYKWQYDHIYSSFKRHRFDQIFVFLECWKKHLIEDIGFDKNVVSVMKHGVDFDRFVDVPQSRAKELMMFEPDDYIVTNMNRNSPRKCWNITISAFLEFLKRQDMDPSIKLFCGCSTQSQFGVNIIDLAKNECARMGLDAEKVMSDHFFVNPRATCLTDEQMNVVYNACDVGLNTTNGEGFGLTTIEHIYFNKPQIVSGTPALKETIGEYAHIIEPKMSLHVELPDEHGGVAEYIDYMDVADKLEYCYKNRDDRPDMRDKLKKEYNWENVYKVLDRFFKNGTLQAPKQSLF